MLFNHVKQLDKKMQKALLAKSTTDDLLDLTNRLPGNATLAPDEMIRIADEESFRRIARLYKGHHQIWMEETGQCAKNRYWITIRPKPGIAWGAFHSVIRNVVERECFLNYDLSFEQKCPEGSGTGFHVHMFAEMKQKSKGQVLRDLKSTLDSICGEAGIDVKPTRDLHMFSNYCIEYKSNDGHKILTKTGDELWRARVGIDPTYSKNENPVRHCLPSPVTVPKVYIQFD